MKSLIQLIANSQKTAPQVNLETLISDEFLESSLREIELSPSSEKDIEKWLNILEPKVTKKPSFLTHLNFSMISQIAAAIIIGITLANLVPSLSTTKHINQKSLSIANQEPHTPLNATANTAPSITSTQLANTTISESDINLAKSWAQESIKTQSAGIYQAANGTLYHAVELKYLELPNTANTANIPQLQEKTEYIFVPVEETY